jgi:hypothetical protein
MRRGDDSANMTPVRASRLNLSARGHWALVAHGALAAALVPAYLLLGTHSRWDDPVLLVALVALGVVAVRSEVPLPSGVTFEALSALALIAVALLGPLPALVVLLAPIAVNAAAGNERLLRAGNLANVAAYGWYTLLGALLLQALAPDPTLATALPALVVVGIVQLLVNWAAGPAIYITLWLGKPARTVGHVLTDGLPTGAVMAALAALTVVLTPALGTLALVLFAAIAVLPQSALAYAARTRPVARLDEATAADRYAHALGVQLRLSRAERRHVRAVGAAARRRPPTGDALDYVAMTLVDRGPKTYDAQVSTEWWNGAGGPLGLERQQIPLAARVTAVAHTWAARTAAGTPQLSHAEALRELEAVAGTRFDPRVVRAAAAVVAHERVTEAQPAPEPRLHRLPLPAALRRSLAATA